MKMTADQLRAHALAIGAEAVIGGRTFNSSRHQVTAKPRAAPAPAPEAPITRAEVEKMLAAQAKHFEQQLAALQEKLP